ncbi:MAG TPA: hypothetical protein VKU00_25635 [Chthonomonadaceae bacterium]|nr:hypothetical protein [Chthonomonadaceae bacterium]
MSLDPKKLQEMRSFANQWRGAVKQLDEHLSNPPQRDTTRRGGGLIPSWAEVCQTFPHWAEYSAENTLWKLLAFFEKREAAYRRYILRRFGADVMTRTFTRYGVLTSRQMELLYLTEYKWRRYEDSIHSLHNAMERPDIPASERLRMFHEWNANVARQQIYDLTFRFLRRFREETIPELARSQITLSPHASGGNRTAARLKATPTDADGRGRHPREDKILEAELPSEAWAALADRKPGDSLDNWLEAVNASLEKLLDASKTGKGVRGNFSMDREILTFSDADIKAFEERENLRYVADRARLGANERELFDILLKCPELAEHGCRQNLAALVGRSDNQVGVELHQMRNKMKQAKET